MASRIRPFPDDIRACLDRFQNAQSNRFHPRLVRWQGREATDGIWRSCLEGQLRLLQDPEVQKGYASSCPVEGALPRDYGIRVAPCEGLGTILTGVHFYGLDAKRPFINLSATDFEITSESLPELAGFLMKEFAIFRPAKFRVWIDAEDDAAAKIPGAAVDQWLLAGQIGEIQQHEAPEQAARISLAEDPELQSFAEFTACFAQWHGANPERVDWARVPDRKELEACQEEGGYFRVQVDDEPAGWIAAQRSTHGPVAGWVIVEELLEAPFRGRGLAAAMQRALLDVLPAEDLVYGTIHPSNLPSLRTALRVGREIVGGYVFLPLGEG